MGVADEVEQLAGADHRGFIDDNDGVGFGYPSPMGSFSMRVWWTA